jgi:beta-galactosidase
MIRNPFALGLLLGALATSAAAPRDRSSFNFDWRFAPGDPAGAEQPAFDATAWQAVNLPHDFAIHGPFDEKVPGGGPSGFRPLGLGWYRKDFVTPAGAEGRRVWLEFEGVYRAPKVWVNGKLIAERLNGYVGFECDLTPHLRPPGERNLIAVRADNSRPNTSRWYTGGGIYRHVWLVVTGPVHVVPHGTYVTTPKVTAEEAWVNVQTEVKNETDATRWAMVTSDILDPAGQSVALAKAVVPIRPGETFAVRQQLTVARPQRWSTAEPHLYRVVSRVSVDGRETDTYHTPFGIRELRVTPDGLFLNGRREFVQGFCIHHDLGGLGAAAFDRAIEQRLRTMKEIGCNGIRLAHNPHTPALLDLCDRLGLLVFNEAFDIRSDQFYVEKDAFKAHWAADLEWFLRRDRNHPSVFIWSVGNEGTDIFRAPDFGVNQSAAMADLVRRLEPTRPVTQALFPMRWDGARSGIAKQHPNWRDYPPHQVAFYMDVMSANYMEEHFARDRLQYPQLPFISSESNVSGGGRGAWKSLDREHAVGLFYWGGMDYLGESHFWPQKSRSAGFIARTGWRTPWSYDVQSFFSSQPMVRLVVDHPGSTRYMGGEKKVKVSMSSLVSHWNFTTGETLKVETYTNTAEVELLLNGRSLGVKRREGEPGLGPRLGWEVPFAPGQLVAIGRQAGREVARHALATAGPPTALRLTPDLPQLRADGQDLAHVTVEVVDAQGIVVPDARPEIAFTVSGPGTNAGVDNGDVLSDELFQSDRRSAWQGRAQLIVRSQRQAGKIVVRATATGLPAAELAIPVR